jgi:hypothetical protein
VGFVVKRSLAPLSIAAVAMIVAVQSVRRSPERNTHARESGLAEIACSDDALLLLGGLEVGQVLGSWRVTRVRCVKPSGLEVDLLRDATPLSLMVVERGGLPHSPPRQTPRHDLFYTRKTPEGASPTQDEIFALLAVLADRVEQAESGMGQTK